MKIKEVCEKTGLTRRAVRFYGEKGLVSPQVPEGAGNDYRDYSQEDVQRLLLVARLREYRFSVEQIRELLEHPERMKEIVSGQRSLLETEREELDSLLEAMEKLPLSQISSLTGLSAALEGAGAGPGRPLRDQSPDYSRLEELTAEERRQTSRTVRETMERLERRKRRRLLAAAAGVLAAVLLAAGLAKLRLWWDEPLGLQVTYGITATVTATEYSEMYQVTMLQMELDADPATGEKTPVVRSMPLDGGPEGTATENAMVLHYPYAGLSLFVEIPRNEARDLGLLTPEGNLDQEKAAALVWSNAIMAKKYARIFYLFH